MKYLKLISKFATYLQYNQQTVLILTSGVQSSIFLPTKYKCHWNISDNKFKKSLRYLFVTINTVPFLLLTGANIKHKVEKKSIRLQQF